MKAPPFSYEKPRTLGEAFELLEKHGDAARLLAGGQSLMAMMNMRVAAPAVLIDLNGLDGLSDIRVADGALRIGGMVRQSELERSQEVARHLPLIAEALPHIAHPAVRNRGTLGGSLALADPAAELPACCIALDATIVATSRKGERRIAARDFFRGVYETALAPGEILVAVEFPLPRPGARSAFAELSRRHGDYALAGVAAHEDGERRLVFFGVADRPVPEEGIDPPGDAVTSAATRRHLAQVLKRRVEARLDA
jgi:aerobic carbon-monoxide dehydrogenase medium subunit